MMATGSRFIHSIYCDDVRHEMGGKTTLVGIYSSELNVLSAQNNDPVALAKLCVAVTAQTPKEKPFLKLKLKLLRDDEVIQQIEIPPEALASAVTHTNETAEGKFHTFSAMFVAQPFLIESSFILRVQAETEGDELTASGIRVILHPAAPVQK